MQLGQLLLIILISLSHYSQTSEYVYPVACLSDQFIYYVYQKTLSDLELWQYDTSNDITNRQLYWRFIPAGFKLLPNGSGFSFVDTNRLRVKKFTKRSPSTIEFNRPIYDINQLDWLDEHVCYFSAKQKKQYAIFCSDIRKEDLVLLHQAEQADCLCPKIRGQNLFCIERHKQDRGCCIIKQIIAFAADNLSPTISEKNIIIDCGYQQVIYLELLSDMLGFYIEHMPYFNSDSSMIGFICHKITYCQQANQWTSSKVFKYYIPKDYLIGEHRLYDSFIPFLPRAKKTALYFADVQQNTLGQYYSLINEYDLILGQKKCILKSEPNKIFFAPILCGQYLFCGNVLDSQINNDESDKMVELAKFNFDQV